MNDPHRKADEKDQTVIETLTKALGWQRTASPEEFDRYMQDSQRKVYALALRLTGNAADAEDLTQEAFLRAYRFFHRYDSAQSFTSWMYRIVTNVHIDAVRRKGRIRVSSLDANPQNGGWEVADVDGRADKVLMESTVEEPLQMGLKEMTPEFRTAVVLADIEGMAYEEIAETMNTSVGTVRSRIHRGRKQLRSFLTKNFPGRYALVGIEEEAR